MAKFNDSSVREGLNPDSALISAARAILPRAYARYSNFQVGACIRADDGQLYVGCNVENLSFGLTQCAEGNAIAAMIAGGAHKIKEILITSSSDYPCPPCGACRQKIHEFSTADTLVHLLGKDNQVQTLKVAELLPFSFNFHHLGS